MNLVLVSAALVSVVSSACSDSTVSSTVDSADSSTVVSGSSDGSPTTVVGAGSDREAARGWLYDTTWPVPTADSWRTSSIATGGLPDEIASSQLVAESLEVGPYPIFGITHDDAIFVLGGAPHLMDLFTMAQGNDLPDGAAEALADAVVGSIAGGSPNAYVAKIDPETMTSQLLDLPKGSTPNYPGSIVAHRNGMLYAVGTATLFEVDPGEFVITRSLDLPLNPSNPESTIYNTLQVSARNGDLILKTAPQGGNGQLIAINVENLEIRNQVETPLSSARMTLLLQGDTEYVYLPGDTATLRLTVTDDGFTPDPGWSQTYRTAADGSTPGVAMTPTGGHDTVVFPNNNTVLINVTAPLEMFWQSTTDPTQEVGRVNATSTDLPGGTFAPPPGDPFDNSVMVAADAVNGRLAAWAINDDGSLENLWVTDEYAVSVGAAIVADQQRLYTDDRECDNLGFCTLYLVVADLMTGTEIARVEVAGSQPSIGRIFIGPDAVYYIATQGESNRGYITKVTATE
jgi:hypothetical protein